MTDYHEYVFDMENRSFLGKFDEMYKQETIAKFDSWHQEDSRQLNRKIALNMIEERCFGSIIDIGCGKGSLTHLLKKKNNQVLGIDISQTAVDIAKSRYPDIDFIKMDVSSSSKFDNWLELEYSGGGGVELIFSAEVLSYIKQWRDLLAVFAKHTAYLLICLYIPENPIGFVKSGDDLENEISRHFKVMESVRLTKSNFNLIYGKKL